uniref:Nucleoplasmin core domain-containing protein n=1 Tax=Cyanoderma ruficeps TaxID=181631 RepID=A0A8C3R8V5_9PASS
MSLSDSTSSPLPRPVSKPWGCELSGDRRSYTFRVAQDGHDEQQQLVLYTLCLGPEARDEFHTVELTTWDGDRRDWLPIATLKPSVLPTIVLNGMEVTPPVTFRLRTGSGPAYVSGMRVPMFELSSEEEDEEEEEEETPERPRRDSRAPQNGAAKGRGASRGRKAAPKN